MTLKNSTNIAKTKPERIKYYKKKISVLLIFHHFYRHILTVLNLFHLHCCIRLTIFRTSSPPTSCQRLGLCPSRSWWSWLLPALKIGRRSRAREREENRNFYQLPTSIHLKIKFTSNKIWTGRNGVTKKLFRLIQMTVRRSWLIRAELYFRATWRYTN